jgi:hypothetical protein
MASERWGSRSVLALVMYMRLGEWVCGQLVGVFLLERSSAFMRVGVSTNTVCVCASE